MPPTLRFAALLGAILALAFPGAAIAAEKGVVPDLTWGVSPADQDRGAAALEDLGAGWVRLNANWADAEPQRGTYDSGWIGHYDRAVELARAAGARIVLMSYQSPSWASRSRNRETPPRHPQDFARYMGFLAARYAGQVEAYEVWNEENIPRFWSTGPNAAAYTRLLQFTYLAIKQADPDAKVVFGGLSTNDYAFLERAYDAGAKGYFDVLSVHPFPCGASPETIAYEDDGRMTRSSFPAYREVRASMLARGDDKPIWMTEIGWSTTTAGCGVSESTQADYLTRAYRFIQEDPYVQMMLWYNLRNNYWDHDANTTEARYGLMRSDFSQKPSYGAFESYQPAAVQTFAPEADLFVEQSTPTTNYGGSTTLRIDNQPVRRVYLRFNPQNVPAGAQATLQVHATTGSSAGFSVRHVPDNGWDELTTTYDNAPAFSQTVTGSSGSVSNGTWKSIDVTPLVTGDGPVSFALTTTSSTLMRVASREHSGGAFAPRLEISTAIAPPGSDSPPTVAGTAQSGQTLNATPGTWTGAQPMWTGYQWRRCNASGGSCADILDASNSSYVLTENDVDATVRVAVTVSNAAGFRSATSAATDVIAP